MQGLEKLRKGCEGTIFSYVLKFCPQSPWHVTRIIQCMSNIILESWSNILYERLCYRYPFGIYNEKLVISRRNLYTLRNKFVPSWDSFPQTGNSKTETYVRPNVSDLESSKYDLEIICKNICTIKIWGTGASIDGTGTVFINASMHFMSNFTKVTFVSTRNETILRSTVKLRSMINLIFGFRLCTSNSSRCKNLTSVVER